MKKKLAGFLLNSGAVYITFYLLQNQLHASLSVSFLFVFVIVLALLNTFLRPIVAFFTFPITFLTLGLFRFVINALMVYLSFLLTGNPIGFFDAFVASLLLSFVTFLLNWLFK